MTDEVPLPTEVVPSGFIVRESVGIRSHLSDGSESIDVIRVGDDDFIFLPFEGTALDGIADFSDGEWSTSANRARGVVRCSSGGLIGRIRSRFPRFGAHGTDLLRR